jgi:hypothetical protein
MTPKQNAAMEEHDEKTPLDSFGAGSIGNRGFPEFGTI